MLTTDLRSEGTRYYDPKGYSRSLQRDERL